jgi:hypothetical protein
MNQAQALAAELGATPQRFDEIRRLPYPKAVPALEQLKRDVQANYKKCAFKYHPDRNPDDPEGAAEKFKLLAVIVERIQAFRVRPQRPQMPRPIAVQQQAMRRRFIFVPGFQTVNTATTTTTTTMPFHFVVQAMNTGRMPTPAEVRNYDARKAVNMKPE